MADPRSSAARHGRMTRRYRYGHNDGRPPPLSTFGDNAPWPRMKMSTKTDVTARPSLASPGVVGLRIVLPGAADVWLRALGGAVPPVWRLRNMRALAGLVVGTTVVSTIVVLAPAADGSSTGCMTTMMAPVYQAVNPTSGNNLLSRSTKEIAGAVKYGFTVNDGLVFNASPTSGLGLLPVHRLYNSKTGSFVWMLAGREEVSAIANYGYVDQQIEFYASAVPSTGCVAPVYRLVKGAMFQFTTSASAASELVSKGWSNAGAKFFVAPLVNGSATTSSSTKVTTTSAAPTTSATTTATSSVSAPVSSIPVPDTNYPIPSGAIYVSPDGSDKNPGSATAPIATVQHALDIAASGGTVVLRAGVYRQSARTGQSVTIQAYPHEQVWLNGADEIPTSAWTSDSAGTWSTGWSTPAVL